MAGFKPGPSGVGTTLPIAPQPLPKATIFYRTFFIKFRDQTLGEHYAWNVQYMFYKY